MFILFTKNSKRRGKTKGQAALEYMITYGWAFIVIIAAVSVLGYFGFLNPNKYIPERCEFGEQLKCVDYSAHSNGNIEFRFRNNFGVPINVSAVMGTGSPTLVGSVIIPDGEIKKVTVNTTEDMFAGTKQHFDFTFNFSRDESGAPSHLVSGVLFAEVVDSGLLS